MKTILSFKNKSLAKELGSDKSEIDAIVLRLSYLGCVYSDVQAKPFALQKVSHEQAFGKKAGSLLIWSFVLRIKFSFGIQFSSPKP